MITDWRDVPKIIQDKVCGPYKCPNSDGERWLQDYEDTLGGERYGRLPRHSKCGKPGFWFVYRCYLCNSIFIRDFGSPYWCSTHAKCWDCMSEAPCASPAPHNNLFSGPAWGPMGLNPRKFTKEELADVFSF